jgi:hypothetical protein
MKNLKKTIVAIAFVALGTVAAYATCPDNVMVVSGDNVYSCKNTGTTSNGTCVYGNCEYIGKRVAPVEEEMVY